MSSLSKGDVDGNFDLSRVKPGPLIWACLYVKFVAQFLNEKLRFTQKEKTKEKQTNVFLSLPFV